MMVNKNSSDSDKKNDDNKSPVVNFLTWLTSPLEIDVTGEKKNNELKKKKMKNNQSNHSSNSNSNSNSNSTKPNINKKSQQQRQRLQQKQQSNSSCSIIHHKDQPKQFCEKISTCTKKLDLLSQSDQSILRESLLLDNCCCDTEDTLEIAINLNPHIELPSHVPTPETIDDTNDNNEPWTNKVEGVIDHALGGIHYHFTNMFIDHRTSDGNRSTVKYGNQPKNNNTDHNIKYAPSFETPPQSPVTNKKTLKSKLLLTPPPKSSRRTKWGSEIWNAKKSSPTNSLATMISSSSSSSLSTDSSDSSSDSFVGELNIDLCKLANQENVRRKTMERNQQQKQKYKQEAAIKKVKPTSSIDNVDRSSDGSSSSFHINDDDNDIPSSTLHKKTRSSNIKPEKATETKEAVAPKTAPKDKRKEKHVTAAAATTSSSSTALVKTSLINKSNPTAAVTAIVAASTEIKTTPLQLRWMYENTLNLQASCPRRGSIRKYDGDGDSEDISLSLLYDKDLRSSLMMREQCQLQPQRNISCHSIAA